MGKETCQRSRSDMLIWSKWQAFFSLIRSLRMLTFLFFRILTVNVRSGSSLIAKQLSESDIVKDRKVMKREMFVHRCDSIIGHMNAWRRASMFNIQLSSLCSQMFYNNTATCNPRV